MLVLTIIGLFIRENKLWLIQAWAKISCQHSYNLIPLMKLIVTEISLGLFKARVHSCKCNVRGIFYTRGLNCGLIPKKWILLYSNIKAIEFLT